MNLADRITVADRYDGLVNSGEIERDHAQERLVHALDHVLSEIRERRLGKKSSHLGWLFARKKREQQAPRGLYIHGAVGRGKTMLMDLFYEQVAAQRKRRVHFHDFMADVHERIFRHREALKRGETKLEDPIPPVASQLFAEAWVLCFDEFSVTDIADAMILSRLFEQLFSRGCLLIATSNVEPDNLYHNGLNRQLFLPFIDLLKSRVDVFNLDSRTDFRLEKLQQLPVYLSPLNDETRLAVAHAWQDLTAGQIAHPNTIAVKGRQIDVPLEAGGVARFTFDELCARPLAASDYHLIAKRYHTIFVENVPVLGEDHRNEAKRFINLIDMLYDSGTRLFMSAEAEPEKLYVSKRGFMRLSFDTSAFV
ncbi:MAG: cell division protein ZapE, partial [Pseudomonadota bacterium]